MDKIGHIKLHRQLLNWGWYDDVNAFRLFTHLLITVNYKTKDWHGITINAGQIVTSRERLALQTNLSEQQVRTSLNKLKSTSELTIKTTNKYTIITITNWKKYQANNQQDNQQITNNQPTNNQQITTTKEDKKIRKEISCIEGVSDFQKIYDLGSKLFPKLATANLYEINKWLENDCSVELDILPELKRKEGQNIGSWSYFTEPIARAKANRLKPMPDVAPTQRGGYEKELSVWEHNKIVSERVKQKLIAEGKLT